MSRFLFDLRLAFRLLVRHPGFSVSVIGILALGIGATTAAFSMVESLFLRPLPFPRPGELHVVWNDRDGGPDFVSFPDVAEWKARATHLERVAAITMRSASLSAPASSPRAVNVGVVSGDFFPMFGLAPERGRLLDGDDMLTGREDVVVVSAATWQTQFASDPHLVGQRIKLDGKPFTVVGIAREEFRLIDPFTVLADAWIPLPVAGTPANANDRSAHYLRAMARRKSSASAGQASAELATIVKALHAEHPEASPDDTVSLVPLQEALSGDARSRVWLLFAAVAFVYLVVCANVASLLLSRASARMPEMTMRIALGARRAELVRQQLTETSLLFLGAALLGALLAPWLAKSCADALVSPSAGWMVAEIDRVALLACTGASLLSGLAVGVVPALTLSGLAPHGALKESAAGATTMPAQNRVRKGLVVAQIAMAFALLVGAGSAVRAFARLTKIEPGFSPEGVVMAQIELPETAAGMAGRWESFFRDAIARVGAMPGVESVAAVNNLPMNYVAISGPFMVEGRAPKPAVDLPQMEQAVVTPGYFRTMGIPLLRGRDFDGNDGPGSRRVIIISQSIASRYFPGTDPIGQRIAWWSNTPGWREIVGVVSDVRHKGLAVSAPMESYIPFADFPPNTMTVVVKTAIPDSILRALPDVVTSLDAEQAITRMGSMESLVADSIRQQRWQAGLLASFSISALVLAGLGLFGLMSQSISQRTREFGIRMALGSTAGGVLRLVVLQGMKLIAVGLVLGGGASALLGPFLASRVAGVTAFDPALYAAIGVLLASAGALACIVPAWRAVRVAPAVALRYE
jgi:putative ABC transport system permease protein